MRLIRLAPAVPVCLVLALLTACGGDDQTQDTAQPADVADTSACDGDEDCAGGFCVAEACVECRAASDCPAQPALCKDGGCAPQAACQSDKQCAEVGGVCDKATGVCVECLQPEDCPDGKTCKAHTCLAPAPKCASSKDCASSVCDKAAGECVDCASDDDCASDHNCLDSLCVPDACPGGVTACADATTRKTCAANGSGWSSAPCAQGDACESGACRPVVCTPGQPSCQQGQVAVCNATGTGVGVGLACMEGYVCVAGGCVAPVCTAGAKECGAGAIRTCRQDGTGWDEVACGAASAGTGSKVCTATSGVPACVELVCTPGAKTCEGDLAKLCDSGGLSLATVDDCSKPGTDGKPRACLGGACVAQKCTAGQVMCADGGTLATCKADGSGFAKTACPEGQGCDGGKCGPLVCAPGAVSCVGKVVQQCSWGGTVQQPVEDCGQAGKACSGGACVSQMCQSGATVCQEGLLATSQSDGLGWQKAPCGAAEACVGTACKAKVCAPGSAFCDGTTVTECDATGTAKTAGENCQASGKGCQDGKCVSQACVPKSTGCQSGGLGVCKADGSGWEVTACPQGQSCQSGACMPWACTPNEGSCEGAKAYSCSGNGLQKTLVVDCGAAGKDCVAGSCVAKLCGNGKLDQGEACDDGNLAAGDGCSPVCSREKYVLVVMLDDKILTDCGEYTHAEIDLQLASRCTNAAPGSTPISAGQLMYADVQGMPASNVGKEQRHFTPVCPGCEAVMPSPGCTKAGTFRKVVSPGGPWPVTPDDPNWAKIMGDWWARVACIVPAA
jgi:hypothetical protein